MTPRIISGKYEIIEQLGRGGMGVVYKVRHQELNADFALKMLHPEYAEDYSLVVRFQHEARVMARMHHSNIVRVTDIDQDENQYYFVMEYVAGRNLDQILRDEGPPPLSEVLRISEQTAKALDHAHTREVPVIHRDVKPSNIMIEEGTGRVVLTDFGIAKLDDQNLTRFTRAGSAIGTIRYCSPEQIKGLPDLDARADIYSLGLVMYEAFTGRRFFSESTEEAVIGRALYDVHENEPEFDGPVPAGFHRLIKRAVAKDRNRRFPTMAALLADLQAIPVESGKEAERRPLSFVLPGIAIVSLFVVLAGVVWLKWPAALDVNEPQILVVTTPKENALEVKEQQELEFSIEADERIFTYNWYLDDAGPVATGLQYMYVSEPGEGGQKHKIHVEATDPEGMNINREWEVAVVSANYSPELLEVTPVEEHVIAPGGNTTFRVKGHDKDGDELGYAWLLDGEALEETSRELDLASLEVGTHEVIAIVHDISGAEVNHRWSVEVPLKEIINERITETVEGSVGEPEPTSVELQTRPLAESIAVSTCESRTFSIEDAQAMEYRWWLDGKPLSEKGPRYQFMTEVPGEYQIAVEVMTDTAVQHKQWTVTATPAPPVEEEVNRWIGEYQRALEQKDVTALRELGYLQSGEEQAFGEKLQRRDNFKVRVHDLQAKVQGSQVNLVFERADTWKDARTYSTVFDYTTENMNLTRNGCIQIIAIK